MIEKKQKVFKNKDLPKALQKKSQKKKFIIIFFIIIWCIVIFVFSSMSGDESNIKSKETINNVIDKTLEVTNNSGITNKHPSENKMNNVINKLNKPLRKCMHASVFFILAILIYLGLKSFEIRGFKLSIIPIVVCFLYACSDEYHQTFVDDRTSEFTDVLIDTVGAIIGIIIINIIVKTVYKIKERKREKNECSIH